MGVGDVGMIGVGKDIYNNDLDQMVDGRILPWVEDVQANDYPVWTDYMAVQRSTYIFNRDGELIHSFDITTYDPNEPDDYINLVNSILDYRAENGPAVHRIPEDTTSVQGAIEWSSDGDIVLISPGTYFEQINYLSKNITIASFSFLSVNSSFVTETILDGENSGSVVTIDGGQDQSAILIGLTIQNGHDDVAGGGIIIQNASPTIDRNIIRNNHAGSCGGAGGGIAILDESFPHLFGNEIYNNDVSGVCDCVCYFGGGIYVDTTSFPILGGSIPAGNAFYGNYADYGMQLFRDHSEDTTGWTPILAHHTSFESCPPNFTGDVYPENGWDLENCHTLLGNESDPEFLPDDFVLYQNYPNPFNSSTTIEFDIDIGIERTTSLQIFDISGRMVETLVSQDLEPGNYKFKFNGSVHPSGLYFIKLSTEDHVDIKKAILVK